MVKKKQKKTKQKTRRPTTGTRSSSAKEPVHRRPSPADERQVVGWREWVALPDFGLESIKAKIDTGARTSSLHAYDVEEFQRGKQRMVRFVLHPEQRDTRRTIHAEAPLIDYRKIKPSSGNAELRPVVLASIELLGERWDVELTLTRRDEMGFRMLLGRQALRGHIVVDPGRSYLNGRRLKGSRRLKSSTGPKRRSK